MNRACYTQFTLSLRVLSKVSFANKDTYEYLHRHRPLISLFPNVTKIIRDFLTTMDKRWQWKKANCFPGTAYPTTVPLDTDISVTTSEELYGPVNEVYSSFRVYLCSSPQHKVGYMKKALQKRTSPLWDFVIWRLRYCNLGGKTPLTTLTSFPHRWKDLE